MPVLPHVCRRGIKNLWPATHNASIVTRETLINYLGMSCDIPGES